jgi:hypothetical protein
MTERPAENPFDVISAKAWETVDFHCITHGITLTDDERDAVQLGLASAVHVAIETFGARVALPGSTEDGVANV